MICATNGLDDVCRLCVVRFEYRHQSTQRMKVGIPEIKGKGVEFSDIVRPQEVAA